MSRKAKKKAQVILETALVLIALILLVLGAVKLFSGLNQNMLSRGKLYSQSRMAAVNSLVQGLGKGLDPKTYLALGESQAGLFNIIPFYQNSLDEYREARVLEAQLKLKEMDNILNFILPYQINQVKEIADKLSTNYCDSVERRCHSSFWSGYHCHDVCVHQEGGVAWGPLKYVQEIQARCSSMITDGDTAYNNLVGAKKLLQDALDKPGEDNKFGPFVELKCKRDYPQYCNGNETHIPKVEKPETETEEEKQAREEKEKKIELERKDYGGLDPRLPAYDGKIPWEEFVQKYYNKVYATLDRNIKQARKTLTKTVASLEILDGPGEPVYHLLYEIPQPAYGLSHSGAKDVKGINGRLEFIEDNIWRRDYIVFPGMILKYFHTDSMVILKQMVDFSGKIKSCCLGDKFATEISEVWGLLKQRNQTNIQAALAKTQNWAKLMYPRKSGTTTVIEFSDDIKSNLQAMAERTDQALQALKDEDLAAEDLKLPEGVDLNGLEYTRNICAAITQDLANALDNRDDTVGSDFYIKNAALDVDALYKITEINRRGLYPIPGEKDEASIKPQ